jgi:transposase InsO family protein
VYCAVVLDVYSRRVVGWSIDSSQTATLVTNALGMAIHNRKPAAGTIIHSDHGPVHLVGVYQTCQGLRSRPVHGDHR